MKKILIGTHNNGKFKEIAYLISKRYKKISPQSLNIKSPKEYIAICKLTNSLKLIIDCDNNKMVIAVKNLFDTPLTIFDITVSYLALR